MDRRLISAAALATMSFGVIACGVLAADALEPKGEVSAPTFIAENEATVPQLNFNATSGSNGLERPAIRLADVTEVPPVLLGNAAAAADRQAPPKIRYDGLRMSWDKGRSVCRPNSSCSRPYTVFEP